MGMKQFQPDNRHATGILTNLEHLRIERLVSTCGAALQVIDQELHYLAPSDESPVLRKLGQKPLRKTLGAETHFTCLYASL